MADMTPMMKQYHEIKEQNKDAILFFRLGDFYEMFSDDAILASRELDLTLTTRDRAKPEDERTPMCGVPYHSCDGYIARLIAKGYKVAICEQTEDPAAAKGLVKRDIIRVVTPGTVDASMLEGGRSNYICAVCMDDESAGLAFCDITTGKTHATSFTGPERLSHVENELGRFSPVEAVLNDGAFQQAGLTDLLREKFNCLTQNGGEARFRLEAAAEQVERQFGKDQADRLPKSNSAALLALGGLLGYLYETQKTDLSHIRELEYYEEGRFMELDLTARRNLELTATMRDKEKRGSLLWVLDRTKTAMGGRLLRSWLERPLLSVAAINKRLTSVEALVKSAMDREELIAALTGIGDMERLIGRIVYGSAGGRDLASLRAALGKLPELKEKLSPFPAGRLGELGESLDLLEDAYALLSRAVVDEPPFSVREGGFIRDGFHPEVDRLRDILSGGKSVIADVEAREREKTGIKSLKVGYNKVFGYYIEVSKSYYDQVPDAYIRKQTLAGCERYITQELKDLEHTVLTASDRVVALEYEIFTDLRAQVSARMERIQGTAAAVAELDALCSLASAAVKNNYCRPEVDEGGVIEIHDGRHPVVERMLSGSLFVPNDTYMGEREDRVAIITGPNMAGKSTYMRQVALITLMAQVGSFVPARAARIGVVDRIFTRIGASDDLGAGQSTFMVEMTEVADILKYATSRSLLILDEIGRGTSTFDGMSIARAVLEHCADRKKLGAKTLFATHYHELTALEEVIPGVKNYSIAIRSRGEELIFLRKIIPGGADRSYGIEVAKLAGLPETVVKKARSVLRELEDGSGHTPRLMAEPKREQVSLAALGEAEVVDRLRRTQPETLTPLEAMSLLYELKQKLN
ncbi:MAG: DNA mismatch repair protein MutS [Oscillospiraceae bacterium]|jgi:DNA mismatch repair protein MutS|nr:DNA mismatch repair protein MutS [Oscillospiraceae bacterium]